jgi:FKBP-type peptidyl-prolyl cis-trans isomerase
MLRHAFILGSVVLVCCAGDSAPQPSTAAGANGATASGAGSGANATTRVSTATPADVGAVPADASVTASGLASRVLDPGTGTEHPTAASSVTVHYAGWTTDGNLFDSSVDRGTPATFPLSGVIAGWTEGLQLMVVGEHRRFWIPGALAYDNSPRADAPRGMLVFDVELLQIE